MTQDQRSRPPLYSQIDVSQPQFHPTAPAQGADGETAYLLRQLLAGQDRQNEILEELVNQISAAQRQRASELGQWKQANPRLAKGCRAAAEALGKVQTEFLDNLTREINENSETLLEGDFMLNEFVDRFGPRMAHLNGLLQVLSQLSATPNPASAPEHALRSRAGGPESAWNMRILSRVLASLLLIWPLGCSAPAPSDPGLAEPSGAGGDSGIEPAQPDKSPQAPATTTGRPETAPADAWPLFRGSAAATGVAGSALPERIELLWTFSTDEGGFESAVVADGAVYAAASGGMVFAIDLATGKKLWEHPGLSGVSAAPAVRGRRVFVGDRDGEFHAIDGGSGKLLWKFSAQGPIDSGAGFDRDHVLFGSQDGLLYCLDAETGKLVWKFEGQDQIRTSPAVVGRNGIVAGCDARLHVVDLDRGEGAAEVPMGAPTGCTPAVMDGTAFVGTEQGLFLAIDLAKADVRWQFESPEHAGFRSSAAVTPEAVLVGTRDQSLQALEPKTGRPLWSFAVKGRVDSSPAVVGHRVFFGSSDGRVYGLDIKTGREVWHFEAGGAVNGSPAVAAGRLVIGSDAGKLYCFGGKP